MAEKRIVGTEVRACRCVHAWQDATYGEKRRVKNYCPKLNNGNGGWRCTVCRAEE